ncbi:MAG TPA: FtsQ-type POTRA domain-containing protein [Gaiellaceae bacterium]|nr:FtsQ-type POTRA domain-containing protein [Gaiellaceae bacterium]
MLVGLALLAAAAGLYAAARQTSVFAIDRIEVEGLPPGAAARVRDALEPLAGTSLVAFGDTDGNRRLATVPLVARASYDRDFPHTLRVTVTAERPLALLRRGSAAWVVSENARVLRRVTTRPLPSLPRIWLPATADPIVGATMADDSASAVRALAAIATVALPVPIRSVRLVGGEVSVTLRSGTEVRFGSATRLPLKAAVAARIIPLAGDARSIDVSVPERAVTSS